MKMVKEESRGRRFERRKTRGLMGCWWWKRAKLADERRLLRGRQAREAGDGGADEGEPQ